MTTVIQRIWPVLFVHKITDGDTFWLRIDQQFRDWKLLECRLDGYDTPESRSSATRRISEFERTQAVVAKGVTTTWFDWALTDAVGSVYIETKPDPEKYGRWLANPWFEPSDPALPTLSLGQHLRTDGLASVWPQRWYQEFDLKAV